MNEPRAWEELTPPSPPALRRLRAFGARIGARSSSLELRRRNHAARDEHADRPFSSKSLLECYLPLRLDKVLGA